MNSIATTLFFFFAFLILLPNLKARPDECKVSKCSDHGPAIRFPFRLINIQPEHCGYRGFDLSCNDKRQTILELPVSVKMVVKKIDYASQIIHVYEPHSCIQRQLPRLNISASPFDYRISYFGSRYEYAFFNCSPPERRLPYLVPCLSFGEYKVYAATHSMYDDRYRFYELISCVKIFNTSYVPSDIFDQGIQELHLSWRKPDCTKCETHGKMCSWKNYTSAAAEEAQEPEHACPKCETHGKMCNWKKYISTACTKCETHGKMCSWRNYTSTAKEPEHECLPKDASNKILAKGLFGGTVFLSVVVIALYLVYTSYKLKKVDQVKIEMFLENYRALKPTRYTFTDIKKITNQFKDKVGEGTYGMVFKGKLSNEIFVAVKVLTGSVGNGEEFITEVGTMGRIHHVNVVRLVGFCAEGTKRALVYEFLENESLEKIIFSKNGTKNSLGWQKCQDIALGIAKGIEYLHQGCDHRILHFDIKPHNVLLGHNFNPKIADFGLAKLCSKEQSIVSMTTARGTMGYIAPEVFSRNFGNVSYKSDVYSFGMLLLEMVSGRKNNEATAVQNTSQAYFPEWVYNRLCRGEELGIKIEGEEHAQIAKKLTIVGLWCIQWYPVDRPCMKNVVRMLEEKVEALTMPPNPFASTVQSNNFTMAARARAFDKQLEVITEVE